MSVGSTGGAGRTEFEHGDPAAVDALVKDFQAAKGSGPSWMSFLDSASNVKKVAETLLRDGKFDAADAKKLVTEAKDYGKITAEEKKVFSNLLRDNADKITPEARDALSKFFNVPIGRPALVTPAFPGEIVVKEGTSEYSLDDDTLIMTGDGKFESTIGRDIYTAGYLPMKEGPMLKPMGTRPPPSSVLSDADNKLNTEKSPVDRFDEAYKRATGNTGNLATRYAKEGKRDEADSWWGFCDRWSYAALDPEIATRVNQPIMYKGVAFSTAELRGLASFMGRSDEGGGMFDKEVSPLDLQKAVTVFLKKNGPGFIGDVWLDKAHPGSPEVWNQPFDGVKQNVKELKGDELKKVLKDDFKLSGDAAAGKRIFYVETTGVYGVEVGDGHEGAASHTEKNWKSYVLTDPDGKATDGKWAPGSADALEYIRRPNRTGNYSAEGKFLRDLLKGGVSQDKVKSFEADLKALPAGQISEQKKAELKAKYAGIGAAYPSGALADKLRPYGLTPETF